MMDGQPFYTLEQLQDFSLEELRALWEEVPIERQRLYRTTYEREARNAGAEGSDQLEEQIARALMSRYQETALIPLGGRWARTPARVQDAARQGQDLDKKDEQASSQVGKPSGRLMAVFGLGVAAMLTLIVGRGILGGPSDDQALPELTNAPSMEYTPTPLALEAQDSVIENGDTDRAPFYPINLQITQPGNPVSRVWVVQRRAIRASEWNYDPNPDTASFLNGMSVRPVIGIPWSEENAAWFEQIGEGTEFHLQMNTGAILGFTFEAKREVRRSETDIFRQVDPGLVLLMVGETDIEGFPTATRPLVLASYSLTQELGRAGELSNDVAQASISMITGTAPAVSPTETEVSQLDVQIIQVTTQENSITTRLRLYNSGNVPIEISPEDIWLALGYAKNPTGPQITAMGLTAFDLQPRQAADITLIWPWQDELYATIGAADFRYGIQLPSD